MKTYLLQLLLGCFGPMFTLFWAYVGYVGTMLGSVELSWAYVGFCWVVFGPSWDYVAPPGVALGLCSLYFRFMLDHLGTMLGLCWVLLGRLGPMLAHLGTMLGLPGFYVGPSWLCVGLSWGYVAPSWDYVERRKDIKVQKLYENMFASEFFTVFAMFFTHSTF